MHKKTTDYEFGNEPASDDRLMICTEANHPVIRDNLSRIRNSIDIIQDRIDLASSHLCMDLPRINMEIYRTHNRALDTWHLLKSDESSGKILETLTCMENILGSASSVIRSERDKYSELSSLLESLGPRNADPAHPGEGTLSQESYSELTGALAKVQNLQNSIIEDIESHMSRDIRSLEDTLNTMILILKDLIERSNITKGPIYRIMSRLQIHDIVKQDIATICAGLSLMQPIENPVGIDRQAAEAIRFWVKASRLSYNLIMQVVSLIREQGLTLIREIENIETTVSHIKEDKDHIAEFLLMNDHGSSAFDITISEISEMMDSVLEKIREYESLKADTKDLIFSRVSGTGSEHFHAAVNHTADTNDLAGDFSEAASDINDNLIYIKTSLIDSIEGIDVYSRKCTESIHRFRLNIHDLIKALDISDNILDEMQTFTFCVRALHKELDDKQEQPKQEIESEALHDLLRRLETPHSNTLLFEDLKDPQEGITFF